MLERNKIYCGDSYKLIKELPDKSVDLIYTDVPYDITYTGAGSLHSRISNEQYAVMKDEDLTKGFDYSILDEFVRVMKKIYIYIWCSKSQIYDLMKYFLEKGCLWQPIVWCKTNAIPFGANNFLADKEYCLCFYESGVKFNDGWEHKATFYTSTINYEDKKLYGHPTIKPYNFVKQHLLNSTQEGDLILDPFAGSGTTLCVAKELKRDYIGIELNPEYFNLMQDRLNGVTIQERKLKDEGFIDMFDLGVKE